MESQLRQLGLQVKLVDAKWYLLSDYEVCKEGKALTADQSKMIVIIFLIHLLIFIFAYFSTYGIEKKSFYFILISFCVCVYK